MEEKKLLFMKTILLLTFALLHGSQVNSQTNTWYQIPTGTTKKLNTINFPSSSVGYIGGNDSLLLKTIDGGETWTEVNYTGVTFLTDDDSILNLKFVTETIGYMTVGPYGGTYKTIDGGSTWTQLAPAGVLCFNQGLFFFDENNGFLGGSGCFIGETIEKMTSGVLATTTINTPTNDAQNLVVDIDFLNSNFGLAASYSGYILRTTNGGLTWDTIPTPVSAGTPLTSVAILNDTLAYAGYADISGGGFGVLRTSDGGLTWIQDISSATFYYPAFYCVHESGDGKLFSGGQPSLATTGLIFENYGVDLWAYYDVDQPIHDMSSYSDSIIFGVGDSGYVVVNYPLGTLSVDENNPDSYLDENSELMVYPNPFSDVIAVNIPIEISLDIYSVDIYNMTGDLIYSAQNKNTLLNLENLPTGVYFIKLTSTDKLFTGKILKQ